MSYPKNKEEWWASLEEHWEDLLSIMKRFLRSNPNSENVELDHLARFDTILMAKANKDDHILVNYLNQAWQNAPDEPWIHELPAWGVLCDLCSEAYVLEDENEPPEKY